MERIINCIRTVFCAPLFLLGCAVWRFHRRCRPSIRFQVNIITISSQSCSCRESVSRRSLGDTDGVHHLPIAGSSALDVSVYRVVLVHYVNSVSLD
jgi:hypothetical protein